MGSTASARLRPGEINEAESTRALRGSQLRLLLQAAGVLALVWLLGHVIRVVWPASLSDLPGRTSYSYRADGYRGSFELARALGYEAQPKRTSYGQLPPAGEGVLVRIDPLPARALAEKHGRVIDPGQEQLLRQWLEGGGRILETAPARALEFVSMLGTQVEVPVKEDEEDEEAPPTEDLLDALFGDELATEWIRVSGALAWESLAGEASESWSFPEGGAALLAAPFLASEAPRPSFLGAKASRPPELQVFSEPLPESWEVVARLDGRPFVVSRPAQAGRVWFVASAWPFSNLALARHGTGAFVARLYAATSASATRALHFDEYAHGLWERGGWLFWLRRDVFLYPACGLGLVMLLLLWRGSQRFGPARTDPDPPRRAKEEFVLGIADVAQRAGRHQAAARALLAVYRARLVEHGFAVDPGWARLEARVASDDAFELAGLRELAHEADRLYRHALAPPGAARAAPPEPVLAPS